MSQQRSPEIFPWSSAPDAASEDQGTPPSEATPAPRRSLSLPNFSPPTNTPANTAHAPIPQSLPPEPPPQRPTSSMDAHQAQQLSEQLRQSSPPASPPVAPQSPSGAAAYTLPPPSAPSRSPFVGRPPQRYSMALKPGRRRRAPAPPWLAMLSRLDGIFRGKLLLWIFGAWAVFWLLGGVALVGLLNSGQGTAPSRPFQASQKSVQFSQPPTDNEFPISAPIIDGDPPPANSGPPIFPTVIALLICLGGGWLRLQQFRR